MAGVHIVGSGWEGMDLLATPDRKTNVNQNLFGLGGTQSLLLCQISLFARQSLFEKGERGQYRERVTLTTFQAF